MDFVVKTMKEFGEDDVINSPEFKKAEEMQLKIEASIMKEEAKKKKYLRKELDQIVEDSGDDEHQIEEEKKGNGDHI